MLSLWVQVWHCFRILEIFLCQSGAPGEWKPWRLRRQGLKGEASDRPLLWKLHFSPHCRVNPEPIISQFRRENVFLWTREWKKHLWRALPSPTKDHCKCFLHRKCHLNESTFAERKRDRQTDKKGGRLQPKAEHRGGILRRKNPNSCQNDHTLELPAKCRYCVPLLFPLKYRRQWINIIQTEHWSQPVHTRNLSTRLREADLQMGSDWATQWALVSRTQKKTTNLILINCYALIKKNEKKILIRHLE